MNTARKVESENRCLVTGGAGFLGSHLCESLLASGSDVLCVDNYHTGTKNNVAHLLGNPRFELLRHRVGETETDRDAAVALGAVR